MSAIDSPWGKRIVTAILQLFLPVVNDHQRLPFLHLPSSGWFPSLLGNNNNNNDNDINESNATTTTTTTTTDNNNHNNVNDDTTTTTTTTNDNDDNNNNDNLRLFSHPARLQAAVQILAALPRGASLMILLLLLLCIYYYIVIVGYNLLIHSLHIHSSNSSFIVVNMYNS